MDVFISHELLVLNTKFEPVNPINVQMLPDVSKANVNLQKLGNICLHLGQNVQENW